MDRPQKLRQLLLTGVALGYKFGEFLIDMPALVPVDHFPRFMIDQPDDGENQQHGANNIL